VSVRTFVLVGMLLVFGALVPLVFLRKERADSSPAATWMAGFSLELDAYAARHEGRFPIDFRDVVLDVGSSAYAQHPSDPWGRPYVFERHPDDPTQCRVFTLGDLSRAGAPDDDSALALYRAGERMIWRRDLSDVPREWTDAVERAALGR